MKLDLSTKEAVEAMGFVCEHRDDSLGLARTLTKALEEMLDACSTKELAEIMAVDYEAEFAESGDPVAYLFDQEFYVPEQRLLEALMQRDDLGRRIVSPRRAADWLIRMLVEYDLNCKKETKESILKAIGGTLSGLVREADLAMIDDLCAVIYDVDFGFESFGGLAEFLTEGELAALFALRMDNDEVMNPQFMHLLTWASAGDAAANEERLTAKVQRAFARWGCGYAVLIEQSSPEDTANMLLYCNAAVVKRYFREAEPGEPEMLIDMIDAEEYGAGVARLKELL